MKSKSSGRKSNSKGKNSSEGFVVIVGVVLVLLILCVLRKLLTKKESFNTNDIPSVTKYINGIYGEGTNSDSDIIFNSVTVIQIKNPIKYFLMDIKSNPSISLSKKKEISDELLNYIEANMESDAIPIITINDFLNPEYLENLLEQTFVVEIAKYVNTNPLIDNEDNQFNIVKLINLNSVLNSNGLFDIYKNKKLRELIENGELNIMLEDLLTKLENFDKTNTEEELKKLYNEHIKNNVNDTSLNLNLFEKIILLEYANSNYFIKDSLTKSGDNYTMTKENIKDFMLNGITGDFEITDQDTYEQSIKNQYESLLKCSADSTNDLCIQMKTVLFPDVLNKPTTTQGPSQASVSGGGSTTTTLASVSGGSATTTQASVSGGGSTTTTLAAGSGGSATTTQVVGSGSGSTTTTLASVSGGSATTTQVVGSGGDSTTTTQASTTPTTAESEDMFITAEDFRKFLDKYSNIYRSTEGDKQLNENDKDILKKLSPDQRRVFCQSYCQQINCPKDSACDLAKCFNCGYDLSTYMTGPGEVSSSLGYSDVNSNYSLSDYIFTNNYDKMMLNTYYPEQYYMSLTDHQYAHRHGHTHTHTHSTDGHTHIEPDHEHQHQHPNYHVHGSGSDVDVDGDGDDITGPVILQKDTEGNSNVFAPIIHYEKVNGDPSNDPNDPAYRKFMDNLQKFY